MKTTIKHTNSVKKIKSKKSSNDKKYNDAACIREKLSSVPYSLSEKLINERG